MHPCLLMRSTDPGEAGGSLPWHYHGCANAAAVLVCRDDKLSVAFFVPSWCGTCAVHWLLVSTLTLSCGCFCGHTHLPRPLLPAAVSAVSKIKAQKADALVEYMELNLASFK